MVLRYMLRYSPDLTLKVTNMVFRKLELSLFCEFL